MPHENAYNSRLFSGGLRRWVHMARFRWLGRVLGRHGHTPRRVLELGCFDAKTIDYLPSMPDYYRGLDANWDGGLDAGRWRWCDSPNIELSVCTSPADLPADAREGFDTVICMETMEHLPPADLERYLDGLARVANGVFLVTVPNEIGAVFAAKWLFKALFYRNSYHYSAQELISAFLGRTEKIERHQHKGFDYRRLVDSISRQFDILEVTPLPISWLPVQFGVTIGVVARARKSAAVPRPNRFHSQTQNDRAA